MKKSKVQPNQTYGMLTVVRRDTENTNRKPFWVCCCQCGQETSVRADYLTSGKIISCGCYRNSKFIASQENIQWCQQLFEQHKSVDQVAQIMKISPSNVQKFLDVAGIEIDISKDELSKYREQDKLRWVKKYVYGISIEVIAKSENTAPHTVLKALNKYNIPTREPGSQTPEMISRFKAKAQEYWQFYKQGLSTLEIAEMFQISSPSVVNYILKAHGYKLRNSQKAAQLRYKKRRIAARVVIRQLIGERGVKLTETKKSIKLRNIEASK